MTRSCFLLTCNKPCLIVAPAAQALHDTGVYGVLQSGDHKARTCVVKWVKLNDAGDDVEVFLILRCLGLSILILFNKLILYM